ncbi:6-phosphogluconolactonase [Folsomia candida]|uniref:6-phosphogluconolactonase n=1 Tax=Folsomia candida TaxID=158441 RepID=A0A226ET15_FOLCA|nr:6-phosphogluconolactonase [Folsomia candida]OXA60204.1 6-phosphogluconolactonase [Folsomia candida]
MAVPAKFLVTQLSDENYNSYLCEKIQEIANEAISSRGVFLLGVSGGSIISILAEGLPKLNTDWTAWKIFLCDERLVPEDDSESTYGQYKIKLFPTLASFPEANFVAADCSLAGVEAAKDYEAKLRALWTEEEKNSPSYGMADCLLLGVGPDGHTCSLFPNHAALSVGDCWVTNIEDSPKPPPARITLTYTFINKATNILIAGKGKEKWDILEKVQNGQDFPIGRVDNPGGHLEWILNDAK